VVSGNILKVFRFSWCDSFLIILPCRLMCLFERFRAVMELIILHNADIKETISVCIFFFHSVSSVVAYCFWEGGSNANKVKRNNRKIEPGG